jgi:hypothetical protein
MRVIEYWQGKNRVGLLGWTREHGRLVARGGYDVPSGVTPDRTVVCDSVSGEFSLPGDVHPDQVDEE